MYNYTYFRFLQYKQHDALSKLTTSLKMHILNNCLSSLSQQHLTR